MSFQLDLAQSPTQNVQRILNEELDFITEQMKLEGDARHTAVHQSRKAFKRIRAVLRLVRDEIGESVYWEENYFYRDTSRLLAPVRDSAVLVDLFTQLVASGVDAGAQTEAISNWLHEQNEAISHQRLDDERVLDQVAGLVGNGRLRTPTLTIPTPTTAAYQKGLQRLYKQNKKQMKQAYNDGNRAEIFHNWRKQVKYLWHATEVLQPLQPQIGTQLANDLHSISDALGNAHDLYVLRELLQTEGTPLIAHQDVQQFLQAIYTRQIKFEYAPQLFAHHLYAPSPAQFIQQFIP